MNSKNSKILLVSFATESWSDAKKRFLKQALDSNFFYEVIVFNKKDLKEKTNFYEENSSLDLENTIGYGFYIWKYYLLDYVFLKYSFDYVFYLDVGFEIIKNKKSTKTFYYYLDLVKKFDIVVSSNKDLEIVTTRCEIINRINPKLSDTQNVNAGFMLFKNNKNSHNFIKLVKEFLISKKHYNLFVANKKRCCERWSGNNLGDQHVFSCLVKENNRSIVIDPIDWIFEKDNQKRMEIKSKIPFHAMRNRFQESIIDSCVRYNNFFVHSKKCKKNTFKDLCPNLKILR